MIIVVTLSQSETGEVGIVSHRLVNVWICTGHGARDDSFLVKCKHPKIDIESRYFPRKHKYSVDDPVIDNADNTRHTTVEFFI